MAAPRGQGATGRAWPARGWAIPWAAAALAGGCVVGIGMATQAASMQPPTVPRPLQAQAGPAPMEPGPGA